MAKGPHMTSSTTNPFGDYVPFSGDEDDHHEQVANSDFADSGTSGTPMVPSTKYHDDKTADQAAETVVLDPQYHPSTEYQPPLYFDVASLLDGTMPESPRATYAIRDDGNGILYPSAVNVLFGDPESGKTWLALWATSCALNRGSTALMIDLDHNGPRATTHKLLALGATLEQLSDPGTFRYVEPEDDKHLRAIIKDAADWKPDIVTVDSMGELLPMFGSNSNSADDFTIVNRAVLRPLAMVGSCVIVIDHLAKGADSRQHGPGGTVAKRRAIDGASIRVTVDKQFNPSEGGTAHLHVNKDRHGSVRAVSIQDKDEQYAGKFILRTFSDFVIEAEIESPPKGSDGPGLITGNHPQRIAEDVEALTELDPAPVSKRDVMARMGWGSARANAALQAFRAVHEDEAEDIPLGS